MFGRGRRKSRRAIDLTLVDVIAATQIVAIHETDDAGGGEPDVSVSAEFDTRFFEMIALLDTSLADLLSTCDRIEQEVAAAYREG